MERTDLTLGDIYKDLDDAGITFGLALDRPRRLLLALENEYFDLILMFKP
jgi:hypothetical protein